MALKKRLNGKERWWVITAVLVMFGLMAILVMLPPQTSTLVSQPHPVMDYAEAVQRIEAWTSRETPAINPVCRLQFMTHGKKVERAIILVHGYTNCPQQFRELGQRFYALGYNVLIVPLPHHGLADRMTNVQEQLSAEELVRYVDEVLDIGHGLGEKVDIAGISAGGIVAAYAAQYRSDVNLAVMLAPAFGYKQIPAPLTTSMTNLLLMLPNSFQWWDSANRDVGGIDHAYPRFSTHALAQTFRLGYMVLEGARSQAPVASKLLMITNANDPGINRELIAAIEQDWLQHGANLETYEFPADLKLEHDFIEPENPKTPIQLVYPKLIELIAQ